MSSRFNPRSPREERHDLLVPCDLCREVSIHAPLARSDAHTPLKRCGDDGFNPRSPREERPYSPAGSVASGGFQSTLPSRGATIRLRLAPAILVVSIHAPLARSDAAHHRRCSRPRSFNPRSPREERHKYRLGRGVPPVVSIHAPLARSDACTGKHQEVMRGFQSTLPSRGATVVSQ